MGKKCEDCVNRIKQQPKETKNKKKKQKLTK